jgi:cytoskeletal protein RodZ
MRPKKPVVRSKKSKRFANGIGAGVIGLAAVCVVATAVVIATREPSQPEDTTVADTQLQEAEEKKPSPKKVPAPQAQANKTPAEKPPAARAVPVRTLTANPTAAKAPAVESKAKAPEANATVAESAGVTITGCLERDNDTFRLKDATGADAPKGRSWKSGFLKKGSASIQIVDAANRLKLANHIGRRVSVTGSLLNREMRARSLQRVGTSCDQSPA